MAILLIGAAGAAGVLARYGIGQLSASLWSTLAINVAGSLALGILVHAGRELSPELRDAIGTGLLGGFTTFSTFGWETLTLLQNENPRGAFLYCGGSVILGLLAVWIGYALCGGAKG